MQASDSSKKIPFSTLNLVEPLNKAIADLGFQYCTPIQAESLIYTLQGHDVVGKAQTGTGKTAAFLITIINDLEQNPQTEERYLAEPRALIIAPTRELAIQIANDAVDLCKYTGLHVVTLVGGEDYPKQLRALDKKPVDIVVATPGRLLDFVQNDQLYLGLIELLVIDEADRMLDMGFIPQVRSVISRTPTRECRQTLLFSATFTPEIIELSQRWVVDPVTIDIEPEKVATDSVDQIVYLVTTEDKYKLLYNLISEEKASKVIIFNNRRDQVRKLADNLHRNGIDVGLLSGEVPQNKRVQTLEAFREGKLPVLVATDVAGRGLHIDDVSHVINYSLPEEAEDYVHRIGRTGRAGAIGTSISFACEEDSFLLPNIEEKLGKPLACIRPAEELLKPPPPFVRPSRFSAPPKVPGRAGSGDKSGSPRSGGGRRPGRS
jgi:ATP-dependent RNA helicase RhlB